MTIYGKQVYDNEV